eukprot:TRINITY_DN110201_c0_g1_i1.p1 TRINITY_DN110201_c0_g1~~TRINITY_DN110201_c0_g1_i1.p1  ORF type:complete len:250 (-),score=86.82 TRINITY_DN110201_c0_g1_i1:261-1010(-)
MHCEGVAIINWLASTVRTLHARVLKLEKLSQPETLKVQKIQISLFEALASEHEKAEVNKDVNCEAAVIHEKANYEAAVVNEKANYEAVDVSEEANFEAAVFSEKGHYNAAVVSEKLSYEAAVVSEKANYEEAAVVNKKVNYEQPGVNEKGNYEDAAVVSEKVNYEQSQVNEKADYEDDAAEVDEGEPHAEERVAAKDGAAPECLESEVPPTSYQLFVATMVDRMDCDPAKLDFGVLAKTLSEEFGNLTE